MPRRAHPLAAVLLGCVEPGNQDNVADLAVALELMDMAVVRHYCESRPASDQRLISGDYWYALAMTIVAAMQRAELVGALAAATSDVARGHSRSLGDVDYDDILGLRSALFPAAALLAGALQRIQVRPDAVEAARTIGVAREAFLAGRPNARAFVAAAAETLTGTGASGLFGDEQGYLHAFVRDLAESIPIDN